MKKVGKLQVLLASLSVLRQNLYGFHWNGKGEMFYPYHSKFQELYEDLGVKIDEVAEHIRTCNFRALFNMADYIEITKIPEVPLEDTTNIRLGIKHAISGIRKLIVITQDIADDFDTDDNKSRATVAFAEDYLVQFGKLKWLWESCTDESGKIVLTNRQ